MTEEVYTTDVDLGVYLGVSSRSILRYRDEGKLPPKKSGKGTPLKQSITQYINYIGSSEKEKPIDREKIRLTAAQADKVELEARELGGELIRTSLVIETWQNYVANTRAKMLTIPTKSAGRLSHETETSVIEEIIVGLVHEALEELSNDGIPEKYRKRLETSELNNATSNKTNS